MSLIDWAAWNPMPEDPPCRVWLPADPPTNGAPARFPGRPPQPILLTLPDAAAHDLACRMHGLLSRADARLGDAVTVDLASAASVHLTALELLLTVLWRRVGPSGDVTLVGGTPGLHAQLRSLGITPGAARAAVYGPLSPAPLPASSVPAPAPAAASRRSGPVLDIPAPRRASDPQTGPRHAGRHAGRSRLVLAGEVNLTVDLRTQARFHELLEPPTRVLEVDLSEVTCLSVSTLRMLVQADARLRARGGRVVLHGVTSPVARLLAGTKTTWLADASPDVAPAPRESAVAVSRCADDPRGRSLAHRRRQPRRARVETVACGSTRARQGAPTARYGPGRPSLEARLEVVRPEAGASGRSGEGTPSLLRRP